jgi:hypothetical protein
MTEQYDIAEIQRLVDDLVSVADTLVRTPDGTPPSPGLARLYADVELLAAAVHEAPPTRPGNRSPAPRQRDAMPRHGPAPDYWFG